MTEHMSSEQVAALDDELAGRSRERRERAKRIELVRDLGVGEVRASVVPRAESGVRGA